MKEAVVASLKFASGLQEKSVTVWITNASQMQRLFLWKEAKMPLPVKIGGSSKAWLKSQQASRAN